ncbi:nucleotidase [Priestia koreensis]|uniref:Nucleotidase n=1 Tax=Priestia koreensis TaxID=284581 RepID=A0A0M0KZT0_9BACI|nr:nucleotidase [Priestia koreensis]KOO44117.1 nucleotidase [Priestia koreensis]
MLNKRFGIDIDGTVTSPSTFIPYLNKSFDLSLTLEDITEYDLVPIVKAPEQELANWFLKNEAEIYENAPLAEQAKDVLVDWGKKHELVFISARHDALLDVTKKWFNNHEIAYNHIDLIGSHNKIEAAKTYDIDVFFEDKHDNACDISEECNIPVLLFDTPYNRLPTPKNVVRVYNWAEANDWIQSWLKTQ